LVKEVMLVKSPSQQNEIKSFKT